MTTTKWHPVKSRLAGQWRKIFDIDRDSHKFIKLNLPVID